MLEFKIDDKIDREKAEEEFEELRNLMENGNKYLDANVLSGNKGSGGGMSE